jgi:hypothetical protein
MSAIHLGLLISFLLLLCVVPGADGIIRQHGTNEAYYPLEAAIDAFEAITAPSVADFNRIAGALALHGDLLQAQRALNASLRLDPRHGDALYMLGSIACTMHRRGPARDFFQKAFRTRAVGNQFESILVYTDACSTMPLLMPGEAIMADQFFPVFAHYTHEERIYLLNPSSSTPRIRGRDMNKRTSTEGVGLVGGETLVKQSSGNTAQREAAVLALLSSVHDGEFHVHFPRVYDDDDLEWVSEHVGRGTWGAYLVEHVRRVSANTHVAQLAHESDHAGLTAFVNGTLRILQALKEARIVHNNLNAEQLLISADGHAVLVDAEIAAGDDNHTIEG